MLRILKEQNQLLCVRTESCADMGEIKDQQILFFATKGEVKIIHERKEAAGFKSLSAYLRKMAIDGYIITIDLSDVKEAIRLLRINANNLNQYAKRANETGSIYLEDIKDLQKTQQELWQVMRDILERLSSIK